jgi:hypothetical protein
LLREAVFPGGAGERRFSRYEPLTIPLSEVDIALRKLSGEISIPALRAGMLISPMIVVDGF